MDGNPEQREFWNDQAGPRWVAADDYVAVMLAPCSALLMERAAIRPGQRVLDVGCGAGHTSLELAQRVGAEGRVVGLDISAPLLERARIRADLPQVSFVQADAQTHAFDPGSFDVVVSRFGVMFFSDPTAAFTRLHAATAPGGRLAFVCWRSVIENPWFSEPLAAIAPHVEPMPPPTPGAPGPFAFADRERVEGILAAAGWESIAIEPAGVGLKVGEDPDDALRLATMLGATAAPLAQATPEARDAAIAAVRETYARAHQPDGVVMRGAVWLVSATR